MYNMQKQTNEISQKMEEEGRKTSWEIPSPKKQDACMDGAIKMPPL